MRFFASGFFFMKHLPPKPLKITLGSFRICSKIRVDIPKSRCTTGINYTGGKFATGINDTSGIFWPAPLASLMLVANLPPVSKIPAANLPPVSTTVL
jgi:hypothetical protein